MKPTTRATSRSPTTSSSGTRSTFASKTRSCAPGARSSPASRGASARHPHRSLSGGRRGREVRDRGASPGEPTGDLVIAADGIHSATRARHEQHFQAAHHRGPLSLHLVRNDPALDSFTFIFRATTMDCSRRTRIRSTGRQAPSSSNAASEHWRTRGSPRGYRDREHRLLRESSSARISAATR